MNGSMDSGASVSQPRREERAPREQKRGFWSGALWGDKKREKGKEKEAAQAEITRIMSMSTILSFKFQGNLRCDVRRIS
jgi:hypothetical protein